MSYRILELRPSDAQFLLATHFQNRDDDIGHQLIRVDGFKLPDGMVPERVLVPDGVASVVTVRDLAYYGANGVPRKPEPKEEW